VNKERSKGIVGIFVLIAFLFVIFLIFAAYTITSLKGANGSGDTTTDGSGSIAVVEVEGVIMSSRKTIQKLLLAEKNEKYKAILLRINSPGGAVGPTQEVYEEIRRIDKDKPVYASFGAVAASGGYYIGAGTRKIFANAGALTGSIGVIMSFMDLSKVYEFVRVKQDLIKAGKYKDIGSPARAMTSEERTLLTEMTLNVHEQFIQDIFKVRGKKIKNGLKGLREYAQGQIFSGEGALKRGLVDELAGMYESGRRIHKELNLKGEFGFTFIKIKRDITFSEILNGIEESVEDLSFNIKKHNVPLLMYKP
jgi:protease-4